MTPEAKKLFRCWDRDHFDEDLMLWNPSRNKLQDWMDRNILEFVLQENRSTKFADEQWVQKYIYIEVHGIFFCSFAH